MNKLKVGVAPYFTSSFSTRKIMIEVLIALVPAVTVAVLFFGASVIVNVIICAVSCAACELLYDLCKRGFTLKNLKTTTALDCSCLVTAVLIAMNVPAQIPWWMLVFASAFAIVVVKLLFGGIGRNIANPAMLARILLLVSFTSAMGSTAFSTTAGNLFGMNASTSASWLSARDPSLVKSGWLDMLVGNKTTAAVGEVSIFALLLGGVYLTVRKIIDCRLPLVIIGSVAVFAFLFDGLPNAKGADIIYLTAGHLINGGLFLGAIFMATDYATSPNTTLGNIIYGVLIGFFVVVLRLFTAMPESVSYALVLMNLFVPMIDKFIVPRAFGRVKEPKAAKAGNDVSVGSVTAKTEAEAANKKPLQNEQEKSREKTEDIKAKSASDADARGEVK